ncbi:MAG: signal peptide peptidase SppA [Thermoguttaceae bacterium]
MKKPREKGKEKEKAPAKKNQPPKQAKSEVQKEQSEKIQKIVCFTLKDDYPEGPKAVGLIGKLHLSLADLLERIDAAAKDQEVAAVWIKIEDLEVGRGKINEIRAAITRLRKAKKEVYAELTTADARQYLVASACNKIIMPESGMLIIPGVRLEMMFFKGFLDKIGVEFDDLKMGKYKGALEPFTRRDMSQPLRESLEELTDDSYEDLIATIGADRGINKLVVQSLMDHGLFTAAAAKQACLIDQVSYDDQLRKKLRIRFNNPDLQFVNNYKAKNIETEFSGIGGFMKLLELMTGGRGQYEKSGEKKSIAVVYAVGAIVEGKSSSEVFGEKMLGSRTIIAALRTAAENPNVVAVVLRIDSPGGSSTASDLIWRETLCINKPLIASMGDVAGSGGYYIAMGAKKIIAEPGTLTGSIGVLGGKVVLKKLYDKLGLNTEVISRGANSGSLSTSEHFTAEQKRVWTELLMDVYRQFVGKAAKGRKMSYEKMEQLAQGRVYSGRMAKKIGLVDELGTLDDAIIAAKLAAGLKKDADVDLIVLPKPKTFFEQLFSDPASDVETDARAALSQAIDLFQQISTLRSFFAEPVLMWMPFKLELK